MGGLIFYCDRRTKMWLVIGLVACIILFVELDFIFVLIFKQDGILEIVNFLAAKVGCRLLRLWYI